LLPINKVTERAVVYTGISVIHIKSQEKHKYRNAANQTKLLQSSGRKRQKLSYNVVFVEYFLYVSYQKDSSGFVFSGKKNANSTKAAAHYKTGN
jgi:hypothetical protein